MRKLPIAVGCGFGLLCTAICTVLCLEYLKPKPRDGPVYVTAAHLEPNSLPGYTLLYSDIANDTAYYIKDDYTYYVPDVGDVVYIVNNKCIVTSIERNGAFYVQSNEIYRGLSGARVKDKDGSVIAFVSSAKDDKILCISIY